MSIRRATGAVVDNAEKIAHRYDSAFRESVDTVLKYLPDKWEIMNGIIGRFIWVRTYGELAEAEKVYNTMFMPLSGGSKILRAFSIGEIRRTIGKKNLGTDFLNKIQTQITNLKKISEYIDHFNKAVSIIHSWISARKIEPNNKMTEDLEQKALRDMSNIERAYEQMSLFMGIVDVINSWSPRGVKEYINLHIEVFNNLKGTMNICKTHSKKILKLLSEIEKLEEEWQKNPNSLGRLRDRIANDPNFMK